MGLGLDGVPSCRWLGVTYAPRPLPARPLSDELGEAYALCPLPDKLGEAYAPFSRVLMDAYAPVAGGLK